MPPTPHSRAKSDSIARRCLELCFGDPDGPGAKVKTQVDRWSGGVALGAWVVGIALVLLSAAVTIAIALAPSLVRSSVSEVVPGLVDSAVSAALRRHGIVEQSPPSPPRGVVMQAPRTPWIFPQAHAAQDR